MTSPIRKILLTPLLLAMLALCSCHLGDDNDDQYRDWRQKNIQYVDDMLALKENGQPVYTKVVPDWATGDFVLMKWHNDRALTEKNLVPLYNSTVRVKYHVSTIEAAVDSSYNQTQYGDSLYQCQPVNTIPGFAIALTNMHVGDSCTVIIPYYLAYDNMASTNIKKPYSTLIYRLKLVSIPAYEIPN
jgi:peptidyl-prolyl cis-trans isomerase